jgi:hypothetical protein
MGNAISKVRNKNLRQVIFMESGNKNMPFLKPTGYRRQTILHSWWLFRVV